MTIVLIVLLALVLTALVVLPLAMPSQADPLPDDRDPLTQDLEEERDALLGAIRELDARDDLGDARREELRARYEAKAARVLRALDERNENLAGTAPPPERTAKPRASWGLVSLIVVTAGIATTLGGFVLPRVGQNASVTSFFEADLAAAEEVRDLRRAAERDPSAATWSALGDAYWAVEEAEQARDAYATATGEYDDAPARAYQRLALLTLQTDVGRAQELLEEARRRDPNDLNTLGTLGELYLQGADYGAALEAFEALASRPEAAQDGMVQQRLALLREVAPLAEVAEADPSTETVMALAGSLWDADATSAAARAYFRVLTEFDPNEPIALARVGELLFLDDRVDDAVAMLDRARLAAAERGTDLPPNTLLFLGNAAFAREDYTLAIDAWEQHLARADDPGRVPNLIERARALRDGDPNAVDAETMRTISDGPALYQANCASCHGAQGGGGAGPRLAGNPASGRPANVESLIRFGRGMMPGFAATLDDEQVETLRDWVVASFGP